jgi:hypothetical protein
MASADFITVSPLFGAACIFKCSGDIDGSIFHACLIGGSHCQKSMVVK